jgi:hypothetical protein
LLVTGLLLASQPARAAWHAQQLPGLHSGKSVAITAIAIGGGAIGGLLLYKKFRGGGATAMEIAREVRFNDAGEMPLPIHNKGQNAVSIREVTLSGTGFALAVPLETPLVVSANRRFDIAIRMNQDAAAKGTLRITYVENGKERNAVVTLRRAQERTVAETTRTIAAR